RQRPEEREGVSSWSLDGAEVARHANGLTTKLHRLFSREERGSFAPDEKGSGATSGAGGKQDARRPLWRGAWTRGRRGFVTGARDIFPRRSWGPAACSFDPIVWKLDGVALVNRKLAALLFSLLLMGGVEAVMIAAE